MVAGDISLSPRMLTHMRRHVLTHMRRQLLKDMPEVWPPSPSPSPSLDLSPSLVLTLRSSLVPTISAARCARDFSTMNKTRPKTTASTLARIVHTLLAGETFDSVSDLVDALKWRLATLRISYTNDDITDALRIVATARPLPGPTLPRKVFHVERRDPDVGISRAEATAILRDRLGIVFDDEPERRR